MAESTSSELKEAFIDEPPAPKDPREAIGQDAQIITTISLDLQFRNIVNVNVKQYDTELRTIRIFVTDQGVPVDTSDYSNAYVQVRRPDGSFIVNTLSVVPGYYVLEISRAMVELSGICKADVTITDGYGVATTMTFFLNVDASVITAEEYAEIPEFQALLAYVNDAQQAAENAQYSADDAYVSAEDAASAADAASTSADVAAASATNAQSSASNASHYQDRASDFAADAKSWAIGPSAEETSGTDTDNAKYWAQQAQQAISSIEADGVAYDNTTSGLTATNVQDATDEIAEAIPFKFGIDAQGNYGYYKEGESQITPFKAGAEGTLPVNPSSTTGMNIWIVTNLEDASDTADIVY